MKKFMVIAAATFSIATPANADLLNYTLSGFDTDGSVEYSSFQLDSTAMPDYHIEGSGFEFYNIPGTFQRGSETVYHNDIIFFSTADEGGIATHDSLVLTYGPQLYSGSESAPDLLTGTFILYDYFSDAPLTLTVSAVGGAVPEPGSWALMIGGFGLVGGALRVRRTSVSYAA